jgi:ubiquinone biosynthesis protein COQ9
MMDRNEAASDPCLALLRAVLRHVPFDGWSPAALKAGAADLGLTVAQGLLLVPGGMRELASLFHEEADRQMLEALARQDLAALKVRERIALAVRLRLEPWNAEREAVRRLLGFLAQPQEAPRAAKLLYGTVDTLWHAAGDASTAFSFYTKRGLLAGIYAATTLYWLDDRSPDGADTDAFLERRIADALALPRVGARLRSSLDLLPNPVRLMRAAGR